MRKAVFLLLVCSLLVIGPADSAAAMEMQPEVSAEQQAENGVMPRMDYLLTLGTSLYIKSDGTTTVRSWAEGYPGLTSYIRIVSVLMQKVNGEWVPYRTYRVFTADETADISEVCTVPQGYYYRVNTTVEAYSGQNLETRYANTFEEWF